MPIQCTCERCGKPFLAKAYRVRQGQSRFCSLACYHAPRAGISRGDGSVLVPLQNGMFAIVDADDAERVLAFNWTATKPSTGNQWYAHRNDGGRGVRMHRFILGDDCPPIVDHIDRNGLNNRKSNLRAVSAHESVVNRERMKPTVSGYRGVTLHKPSGLWRASITKNRKVISLRYHDTPEEAARAYDKACRELFGDFCVPNFPDDHAPPPG